MDDLQKESEGSLPVDAREDVLRSLERREAEGSRFWGPPGSKIIRGIRQAGLTRNDGTNLNKKGLGSQQQPTSPVMIAKYAGDIKRESREIGTLIGTFYAYLHKSMWV